MSDKDMEGCHNYIQWMFPTKTRSQFNKEAPELDVETIIALKDSEIFNKNLELSINKFLKFLGITLVRTQWVGLNSTTFYDSEILYNRHWHTVGNHNLLRISRLLECLSIFSRHQIFGQCLLQDLVNFSTSLQGSFITKVNIYYWLNAYFLQTVVDPNKK
jgi:hypothetical protein